MMMLMTNTGKRFQVENVAEGYFDYESADLCLLIKVLNSSVTEVANVFNNQNATKVLSTSFIDDDFVETQHDTHYNFTAVDYIRQKRDGGILIRLKRPEV